jgi:hypothetical protein
VIAFDRIAIELCRPAPRSVRAGSVAIETDPGELIDKITMLEINAEAISDDNKLSNVWTELETQSPRSIRAIQMAIVAEQRGTPVETALV